MLLQSPFCCARRVVLTLVFFEHIPLTASCFVLPLKVATSTVLLLLLLVGALYLSICCCNCFEFVALVLQLVLLETKPVATYEPCVGLIVPLLCRDGAACSRFLPLSVFVLFVGIPVYFSKNL